MLEILKKQVSADGTVKYLLALPDGNAVETVLMHYAYGSGICLSAQAGCRMGCVFCASKAHGLAKSLTAYEMLAQIHSISCNISTSQKPVHLPAEHPQKPVYLGNNSNPAPCNITRIVIMGTGEPFDNYDEVLNFCDIITSEQPKQSKENLESYDSYACLKLPIAPRHITVSTCGIVPRIYDFAKTKKRYNLAVSLHAPNDMLRDSLMPVNKKYPLKELVAAISYYCLQTGRRVTLEYILLEGINDHADNAMELAEIFHGINVYVNLIPYNNVDGLTFKGSDKETTLKFYDILMKNGIKATLRKQRGADISAACGQLKALYHL